MSSQCERISRLHYFIKLITATLALGVKPSFDDGDNIM